MPAAHRLTREEARRIAVRAQLLDAGRPADVMAVVRHLTALQADPTSAVAPNADVILWSRLGSAYCRDELSDAVEELRLIDLRGMLRPAEDIALFRAEMVQWNESADLRSCEVGVRNWVHANDACRNDILERLRMDGPLPLRELPDTCVRPWKSSGWTNNQNVRKLLDAMVVAGQVAAAGRDGKDRLWDLAERIYPDDPVPEVAEAAEIRARRRLAALGIAREKSQQTPLGPSGLGAVGEPATVEGVRGAWRVDAEQLAKLAEPFRGRTALLSPLDQLIFDRKRMAELFEFDYQLEQYKPEAKRRWGYWAMPILHGDRLIGKLDATADAAAGVLRVDAIHADEPFTREITAAVDAEIADLARWLGLQELRAETAD